MGLLKSIIYNFYKSSIGVFATWQELWMLVGHDLNMVNFRPGSGEGKEGLISCNFGVYRHL